MNFYSLFQAPADTNAYFIAGYAVFFTVMVIYTAVLFVRNKNLKQEYELLKELEEES